MMAINSDDIRRCKMRVAIIGSSHVARMKDYCVGVNSHFINDHLNVDRAEVAWFGRRGGTIKKVWDGDLRRIIAFAPQVAIILLGGNDIDGGIHGDETASGLIALSQILRKWTPATQIYICGILPRTKPRSIDPAEFMAAAQSCNETLRLLLQGSEVNRLAYPGVHFWRIRRLTHCRKNIFLRDGTHLNDLGNLRLYYNLQHAVKIALRSF